jgi:AcrR family transcriptional regulator
MSNAELVSKVPGGAAASESVDLRNSLITAALALAVERHNWDFSMREVARKAGVSEKAPHKHFPHKRDLLAATAVLGHHRLRVQLKAAVVGIEDSLAAFLSVGSAYVKFGIQNAELYRLMFSGAVSGRDWQPGNVIAAGVTLQTLMEELIAAGASKGVFRVSPTCKTELKSAALFAWALVHGFTMLVIDKLVDEDQASVEALSERVSALLLHGIAVEKP